MTAALLMAAQVAQGPQGSVHHGRQGSVDVPIPRLEGTIAVDGVLDEAAWARAALLTGFSQYMPVDGAPAVDSTDVLVWYDADGIYFGIQAHEPHGIVNATLADRDRIDNDDYVQILLDAFNDRRRALVIGVNPLGVQADGIRSEGSPGAAAGRSTSGRFENVDMNPDFTYTSKGRLTAFGYEVEVFIPFKSLRFQATDPQDWALNVIRKVQHSGYENTWTPVRRANASFLAQSGTLQGLTGLSRGLVLDLNPFATLRADGGPASGEWEYDTTPEIGANGRWGITNNLTLDATINPDFAQVEADVGAITINERFAVFFPERRPFFLEGIEQFDTPNTLIYTRRIIEPVGGAKLTGKIGPINIGALSSVEDKSHSSTGDDYPLFNLFRIRGDLGENSTAGLVYTDKIDGDNYNRVIGGDARIVFAKLYYIEAQLVGAFTKTDGTSRFGPLWEVLADRTGRHWGFHYSVKGISSDFEAQSGFVNRTGVVEPTIFNRITTYGQPGAFLENYTTFIGLTGVWDYDGFFEFAAPLETSVSANNRFTLRGGWAPSITPSWSTAAFDPAFYADYYVETTSGGITDTVSFAVPDRVNDAYTVSVGIGTPQFPVFSMSADASAGKSVAYFEPSRANTLGFSTTLTVRPTNQLRIEARYAFSRLARERDGTQLSVAHIPRLKIEYQIARPLFVRFVGQYASQAQDALRDPRTDEPILITDPETGIPTAAEARTINDFRLDLLLSFRPTPGTVVFLGYGASLTEPNRFRFTDLERTQDGFFAKVSYLFRM